MGLLSCFGFFGGKLEKIVPLPLSMSRASNNESFDQARKERHAREKQLVKHSSALVEMLSKGQQEELRASFNQFDLDVNGYMCARAPFIAMRRRTSCVCPCPAHIACHRPRPRLAATATS